MGTKVLYIAQNTLAFIRVTSRTIKQTATTHSCAKDRLKHTFIRHMGNIIVWRLQLLECLLNNCRFSKKPPIFPFWLNPDNVCSRCLGKVNGRFALLRNLVSDMTARIWTKCLANRLLTLFLPEREEATGGWRKLQIVNLHTYTPL